MDPHTARCLQLSSSICMPFNPYRPHQFPDPANRSRYTPPQQGRPARSNTMPSHMQWRAPAPQSSVYQQTYNPTQMSRNGFAQQQYRIPAPQTTVPPKSMELDTSFYQTSMPSELHFSPGNWDSVMTPEMTSMTPNSSTVGMTFSDGDQVLTPTIFSASTSDSFDEFVKSNEEPWEFQAMSPDRQSWSELSASSGEAASEFPELPDMYSMPVRSGSTSGLGVAFGRDEIAPKALHSRIGRSSSRPPTQPRHRRYRSSPYSINRTRSSSMSTALSSMPRTQCCSPLEEKDDFLSHDFHDLDFPIVDSPMGTPMFDTNVNKYTDFYQPKPVMAPKPSYSCDDLFMSPGFGEPIFHNNVPSVLPSSGFYDFNHTQNTIEDHGDDLDGEYADEPDLFGPLSEEQSKPDEEAMHPENPEMEPTEQELRFEGDLYTPKFVRGHGNKREGYCGICKPGRWLVLKNSAYWYDKSFTHGISAATGLPFDAPKETRRMNGNPDVWEGLCGSCGDWIALISNKKKGTTWFRHAYKCHTHQKAKDAPKRRRDTAQNKASKVSKSKGAKIETRGNSPDSISSSAVGVELEAPANTVSALQAISGII